MNLDENGNPVGPYEECESCEDNCSEDVKWREQFDQYLCPGCLERMQEAEEEEDE